jgi:hypothetical protein
MHGGSIGNRGRCSGWRRQFRPVTSRKARDRIRCTSEAVELVRGAKCGVGKRRRASGWSERGALSVRGGWAGVRESVDRTSVVDGGCRGRDSRRRRPCKGERFYGSLGAAEHRQPAAQASPPARSGKRRDQPALRLSSHRLPKNGKRPPLKSRATAETAPRPLSETSPPTTETRRPTLDAWARNRRPPAVERAEPVHRQRHAPHLRFLLR